jgi:phosphoglucomutase
MKPPSVDPAILAKARTWLEGNYDEETKTRVRYLLENEPNELVDAFYRDLEFGTGGLRGIMGVGTNRMNIYTVGMATQGLANYLKMTFGEHSELKAAIAYDSRNNNTLFADITARVLSANGIRVFLFDGLRPTPELSFAIRFLGCHTGVVITASHNPKEYNGYKVYWNDGGQLVHPHDTNIISEVMKIKSPAEVKFDGRKEMITTIGEDIDKEYIKEIKSLSLVPALISKHHDLKIVYTPLHGTGVRLVPMALKAFGFDHIIHIPEQDVTNGDFPTVKSPNPEEPASLSMALDMARRSNADIVMGTDPDGDRVGVAVRNHRNEFILLNGNQTASILTYYILTQWKEKGRFTGNEFVVKTIVTSELLRDIAVSYGVDIFDVLTGFKYIAELIRKLEGTKKFICGGEESYGYLTGDFVRDKDAVSACSMIAEAATWAAARHMSLFDLLIEIYMRFGFYREKLISVVRKGRSGAEAINRMMEHYRNDPFKTINGIKVIRIKDFLMRKDKDMLMGTESPTQLPESNVIQFFLEDGSKITVRPSGTEPKIKFYFGAKGLLRDQNDYEKVETSLDEKIEGFVKSMNLSI